DGTYFIRLRETTYGGGDNFHYRLHIGTFARPTSVFPAGGQAGQDITLTFVSPTPGPFTQSVHLSAMPQEKFGVYAVLEGLSAPTPNWLRVSDFPNVLAIRPNQDREHATTTERNPPVAFDGIISQNGQEDWFRFPATKDVPLTPAVYARRLRSPLDSVLEILDPTGKNLASDDDANGADSSLKFTPTATTNYFLRVRDTMGHGGPDFIYHAEV